MQFQTENGYVQSRKYVEQRAKLNAELVDVVHSVGDSSTLEEAFGFIAEFVKTQSGTLLAVKISDWSESQEPIRPHSNFPEALKAVIRQLKHQGGCPMTKESRERLAPFSYQSVDRQKYATLLDRRFFQETDRLGFKDIAIIPVMAGRGILIATVGLNQIYDRKLRSYSSAVMPHFTAAILANFPQVAKLFEGKLLSELETSVLTAHCKGLSSQEVGELVGISVQSLPLVWKSAEKKLEASNRYQAVYRAIAIGELDLPRNLEI